MRVIMLRDVGKLGRAGELLEVSDGYARNYLIPRGKAIEGTAGRIAEWRAGQARIVAREERERAEAVEWQKNLRGKAIIIEGRAGENGKLFGSVTATQIAEALDSQHGLKGIDKRDIKIDEVVKAAGNYQFSVKLYSGVQVDMTLTVTVA